MYLPDIARINEKDRSEAVVWGWTREQYMVAWTYFKDHIVVLDASLPAHEQDDMFLASLLELQATWRREFRSDPCTGPMQVYAPEISPTRRLVVEQVFARLHIPC